VELLLGSPLDTVKPTDYQSDFRLHRRARLRPSHKTSEVWLRERNGYGHLKRRGAKSFRHRRHVSHSCAVPGDSK
jgi:hypothetical protein